MLKVFIDSGTSHVVQIEASADKLRKLEDFTSGISGVTSFPFLGIPFEVDSAICEEGIVVVGSIMFGNEKSLLCCHHKIQLALRHRCHRGFGCLSLHCWGRLSLFLCGVIVNCERVEL